MSKYKVVLFYRYVNIVDGQGLMEKQKLLCTSLGLKGRMIIASEGINGTFEGKSKDVNRYCEEFIKDKRFSDVHFKFSEGNGCAFPKLSIKVRDEIVSGHLGDADINPNEVTGKYITPEQLHEWFEEKREFYFERSENQNFRRRKPREFYIVDMRNDFEQEVGMFEGSIKSGMHLFRDLPKTAKKISSLKNKTIVTVCTGGVRCEKASGFLVKNGFAQVYQLAGGIHNYMEKYPNEHFKGALYVFDQRVVVAFNMDDPKRAVIGKCAVCGLSSENYVNCRDPSCNRHFIACVGCAKDGVLCPS